MGSEYKLFYFDLKLQIPETVIHSHIDHCYTNRYELYELRYTSLEYIPTVSEVKLSSQAQ